MRKRGEGGWFTIPGLQDGERTLEEGIRGLEPLADHAEGATVLDLGCAEGLIGQWFVEHGAAQVDGLDANEENLAVARGLAYGLPMTFCRADFNAPEDMPAMEPQYDIVLCLSVLHKLEEPHHLLEYALSKARKWLAVRAPHPAVGVLNVLGFAKHRGFTLQSEIEGTPWLGLFSRA